MRDAPHHQHQHHHHHPTIRSITEKRSAKCRQEMIPGTCCESFLLLFPRFCSGKNLRSAWQLNRWTSEGGNRLLCAQTRVHRSRRSVSLKMMMMMMMMMPVMTGTKYYQTSRRVTMTAYHNRFRYHYTAIVHMYDEIIFCLPEHNTTQHKTCSQL